MNLEQATTVSLSQTESWKMGKVVNRNLTETPLLWILDWAKY